MISDISDNIAGISRRIEASCGRAGRDPSTVELIGVTKTFPVEAVREAVEAGLAVFGENKLQEAEPKIAALPGNLHWHFIGRVQRNKLRRLLQGFEVIHGIDSFRLAASANEIAAELGLFPRIFLQVNIGEEASKGGFSPDGLRREMEELLRLERIEIMGLMAIPPAGPDAESSRPWFRRLREIRDSLEREFEVSLPALSMGMSNDFEVAVEEGATHVRVGSAIFGTRSYRVDGEPP